MRALFGRGMHRARSVRVHGARPYLTLAVVVLCVWLVDVIRGVDFFTEGVGFAIFEEFAYLGTAALAMSLLMVIGEFDLSIGAVFALGGIVVARLGGTPVVLGLAAAACVGALTGSAQGWLTTRFKLNSPAVTLAGLLALGGLAEVLTAGGSIPVKGIGAAADVNYVIWGILSTRAIITIIIFAIAAFLMARTPLGRLVYAAGGSRRAVVVMGASPGALVVITFALCEALAALGGGLYSDSVLSASSLGLTSLLAPSVAAAMIGGVSFMGGQGTPLGVAAGVLALAVIDVGLVTAATWFSGLVYGLVLLAVAIAAGPDLLRRITVWGADRSRAPLE